MTKTGKRGRKPEFVTRLVTEVTKDGRLIGACVWAKNQDTAIFVEAEDLNAVGHAVRRLAHRVGRAK